MGKCIIFCAGECPAMLAQPEENDRVLAADGGLRHARKLGVTPHEILGDFDSLGYVPANATVHPVEKDDTDAMLAARRGLALGFREFWFYGSLDGPRLDHTVANFQMLRFLADREAFGYLIGQEQLATVIRNGSVRFPAEAEGVISVFCAGDKAEGVTLRGLKYPMANGILSGSFPLGVSNHFAGDRAEISVGNGSLLIIWDREAGIPERGEAL